MTEEEVGLVIDKYYSDIKSCAVYIINNKSRAIISDQCDKIEELHKRIRELEKYKDELA